jgi:hypothetical protein
MDDKAEGTNPMCSICLALLSAGEDFLFASPSKASRYRYYNSYLLLSLSARDGCAVCRLISEVLLENAISRATVVDLFTTEEPIIIRPMQARYIGIDNSYIYISATRRSKCIEALKLTLCLILTIETQP